MMALKVTVTVSCANWLMHNVIRSYNMHLTALHHTTHEEYVSHLLRSYVSHSSTFDGR